MREWLRRFRYKSCPSVGVAPSFVSTLPDAILMISGERGEFFKPDSNEKATAYLTSTRVRASALRLSARGSCAVR